MIADHVQPSAEGSLQAAERPSASLTEASAFLDDALRGGSAGSRDELATLLTTHEDDLAS